ncbi:heavy metal-binding domain-containing protein [Undibacterium sp. Ji83W]|uniref:heavy metal-binding domain-containing protein n=1 Tax=Undibacterium sp. Ji83W TaxID=3413043 RepID=UPI003BF0ADE7
MTQVTGLSGNEIFCLAKKNMRPGEIVIGNSVNSMGFLGSIGAGVGNILGGEIAQVTSVIHDGRANAFSRMVREAVQHGADGVAGVTSELRSLSGKTEFLFVGSAVHVPGHNKEIFTSAGDAQELYCHMDAGYQPLQHVFGNVAYSMGIGGSILGSLKTLVRGEVREFSDIFNVTRHVALARLVKQAKENGANSVVGIRTTIEKWMGVHEMLMTGTAAFNSELPQWASQSPVTSDMTGEELWAMTSLGFAPVKLLMSTSIYSLGLIGGFLATIKSIKKGEISDLTTLIHDARVNAVDRLKREATEIGADEVIGVKTYIAEIGNGLVEFMAIGTAVKKISGMSVKTATLPVQAIIRDRDTWIDGEFGISLDRQSA